MKVAIIDLGTNTFNLLIGEILSNKSFNTICVNKEIVKLGKGGFSKNIIIEDAYKRAICAIKKHVRTSKNHNVNLLIGVATSGIRSTKNGKKLVKEIENKFNFPIYIIDGDKEAEIIYYGVKNAIDLNNTPKLIIDIGGGSTEFIIANKNQIFWKESTMLGASRLIEKFKPSDPVKKSEINNIKNYFNEELRTLKLKIKEYKINTLIGASGSFTSFAKMIVFKEKNIGKLNNKFQEIDLNKFIILNNMIKHTNIEERLKIKGLSSFRADMIVMAGLLIEFIIENFNIKKMYLSRFALKEGILYLLANKLFEKFLTNY